MSNMEEGEVVAALAALAHDTRLRVFRALVPAGPEGLPAGAIAGTLGIAPASLSFHLSKLRHAGLVDCRRRGRQLLYLARYDAMSDLVGFLTERCCRDAESTCGPVCGGDPQPGGDE